MAGNIYKSTNLYKELNPVEPSGVSAESTKIDPAALGITQDQLDAFYKFLDQTR